MRTIDKPEDAEPIKIATGTIARVIYKYELMFTVAECAQIASRVRILQEELCCAKIGSPEEKKAADELIVWESKFMEWMR